MKAGEQVGAEVGSKILTVKHPILPTSKFYINLSFLLAQSPGI
jgi:hypothetical protein